MLTGRVLMDIAYQRCGRTLSETYLKKIKSADIVSMYTGAMPWEFILHGKYQKKTSESD